MLMKDLGIRHSPRRLHTTEVNTAQEGSFRVTDQFSNTFLMFLLHDKERDWGILNGQKGVSRGGYSGCITSTVNTRTLVTIKIAKAL